jgi:hypothetical protein
MRNNVLRKQRDSALSSDEQNNEPFNEIKMKEIKNEMKEYLKGEFDKKKDEFVIEITDTIKHEIDDDKENISKESTESESDAKKNLKKEILTEYIYPDDKETIKLLLDNRKFYTKLLQLIRFLKIFFSAVIVPGLLLSDTQFPGKYLNYVAGISSFLVACFELGDRMIVESNKRRIEKINIILDSVGIKYRVPDSTLDDPLHTNNSSTYGTAVENTGKRQLNSQNEILEVQSVKK